MKQTKEKGITLIALIITIIVMLILVGVSVTVAINGGLFGAARSAKVGTQYESDKETLTSAVVGAIDEGGVISKEKLVSYLKGWTVEGEGPYTCTSPNGNKFTVETNGKILEENQGNQGNQNVDRTGLKVGDYINYTPDVAGSYTLESINSGYSSNQTITQDSSLKWRILKIYEDGRIELVSNVPTSGTVYFQGAIGYNNGVYLLHDMCEKLYSNKDLGITARSINLEDIESQMTEAGKAARDAYSSGYATYGTTKTYTGSNSYYPNLYEKENGSGINTTTTKTDGINDSNKAELDTSSTQYKQASTSGLTVTQTYYYLPLTTICNSEIASILTASNYYWVASRYVICGSSYAYFGLRYASSDLNGNGMFNSSSGTYSYNNRLRPVVSLGSDIQITAHAGTASEMHEIVK